MHHGEKQKGHDHVLFVIDELREKEQKNLHLYTIKIRFANHQAQQYPDTAAAQDRAPGEGQHNSYKG